MVDNFIQIALELINKGEIEKLEELHQFVQNFFWNDDDSLLEFEEVLPY